MLRRVKTKKKQFVYWRKQFSGSEKTHGALRLAGRYLMHCKPI